LHLLNLIVVEREHILLANIVLASQRSAIHSPVRHLHLTAGATRTVHLHSQRSHTLNRLHSRVREHEDTIVIIVQDHDGGQVRIALELGMLIHVRAQRGHLLEADIGQTDIELLVFLVHVIVDDLDVEALNKLVGPEGERALGVVEVGARLGSAVLCLVVDKDGASQVATSPAHEHLQTADALEAGVVGGRPADCGQVRVLGRLL